MSQLAAGRADAASKELPERGRALRLALLACALAALTCAHFLTDHHAVAVHDLLFKVTFVPLILAGLWFRPRVALACSAATSAVYLVHVYQMSQMGHGSLWLGDVVLYNVVAGLTALLTQRRAEALARVRTQARQLEDSARALLRAEETIRTSERLRSLGELASGMAHEIRNPLGGIRGAAEVVVKPETPPAARAEFGALLESEIARLDRVVANFLEFARPPRATPASVPLAEVVARVFLLVAGEARGRGVELVDEVPPACVVRADPDLLRQVLLNVVLNALQAHDGPGRVRVRATPEELPAAPRGAPPGATERAARVQIDVIDGGRGVPERLRRTLFDPYVTGRDDGTGMGLAVASRLAETMDATLALNATSAAGSTFRLSLPSA